MNKYSELLGHRIKYLRKEKNITQERLAEIINRSKNHISKIELGLTNPPISLVFDIAQALNVHPHELFIFSDVEYSFMNDGNYLDELKKIIFHQHPLNREKLTEELGDVMWYYTLLLDYFGISLNDVLFANIKKYT